MTWQLVSFLEKYISNKILPPARRHSPECLRLNVWLLLVNHHHEKQPHQNRKWCHRPLRLILVGRTWATPIWRATYLWVPRSPFWRMYECNEGVVEQWKEELATLVNRYESKNTYNCGETGIYYKLIPDRTLTLGRETWWKIKQRKTTILLCCNGDGSEKFPNGHWRIKQISLFKERKETCLRLH